MVINREYIKQINEICKNRCNSSYIIIKNHFKHLYDYIMKWTENKKLKSFSERVFWSVNTMDDFPKCEFCGKSLTSVQFEHITTGYRRHCSKRCAYHNPLSQQRRHATNMEKYGVDETFKSQIVKEKISKTNIDRYGAENPFASEEIKDRIKKYWIDNFGVENPLQLQTVKDIQASHRKESKLKEYETKRKNKTFNTSKPEEECYKLLCEKIGNPVIERQYNNDPRYPFQCDFYIKSLDLFIEYNGHWTHGKHPYDENNEEDIKTVNKWMERSEKNKFYTVAINVWTKYDVKKRNIAINSKLRRVVEYG